MELFQIYTYGVVRKGTAGRHELADLLAELRNASRMSREQLADAGGVSVGPIKRIETEGHVPKAQTLQLIANGLATYAPGRRDDELATEYYQRLMRAAGHIENRQAEVEPERRRPVEDLTDEEVEEALARYFDDEKASMAFLSTAQDWREMSPPARRLILNSFEEARRIDEAIKAAQQRDATRPPRRPGS